MAQRSYRWLTVTLAVVGLTADQATKYGMFRWLYHGGEETRGGPGVQFARERQTDDAGRTAEVAAGDYDVVPGWFRFTAQFVDEPKPCDCLVGRLQTVSAPMLPRVNHGALFGLGGEHKGLANQVFAGISVLALAGILVWVTRAATKTDRWLCGALGLIFGGTVGNLYDRIVFDGVRDFLYFYKINFPVFNVADCCLVVGATMLLIHAFFPGKPADAAPPAASPVTPAA